MARIQCRLYTYKITEYTRVEDVLDYRTTYDEHAEGAKVDIPIADISRNITTILLLNHGGANVAIIFVLRFPVDKGPEWSGLAQLRKADVW